MANDTLRPAADIERPSGLSGKLARDAALALRAALLSLLQTDQEVIELIRAIATPEPLGGSEAEKAALIVDLIEGSVNRMVRPDALRRLPSGR